MNWDNQLSSILSVADGSVAKMRERLTLPGKFSKGGEDLFPVKERIHESDLDPPALPPRAPLHRQPSPSLSPGVQWADLAAIQSQLQIQSQAIESLTQKLHDMQRERQSQQCHIQTLQEEIHRLRERELERDESRRGQSPGAERRMEQWKREVGRELSSLRGHITRATSLGNLEESFSSKLRREELEHLRREVDQLKTRLRRQEEDAFLQQAEARETRRQYEHSCKTLEELTDSYRTHSTDLAKTVSQYSHTQEEVRQIRTLVLELKEEVRRLILREREPTPLLSAHISGASPLPLPHSHSRRVMVEDADSESDFSPTPSLAEVSSDDLSWLDDKDPAKGTLSEDTIRVFLQQIAGAMRVLQAKGIIHRDLKPQNILLSYPPGRKSHSNNTCIKIADFGFARYLQNNMMAATLCGSPMYMAPEVIMSQSYDAKADLWSIGTIVFQCLTGKAPFQASSPQDLRLFYEKNKTLSPNIPRETSSHLRHLLLGLLQRNHKDRMDFDEFFCHPFLEASSSVKKTTPTASMTCFPSSASASSCSSSSTSHLASPPQSLAEVQHLRAKALVSPTQEAAGFLLKDSSGGGGSSKNSSSCDTDDFVMVPAHFTTGELTCESKVLPDSLMNSGSLLASAGLCSQAKTPPHSPSHSGSPSPVRPSEFPRGNYGGNYGNHGQSLPIPVPTQLQNYQRMEQNLHSTKQDGSPRLSTPVRRCSSGSSLGFARTGPLPPHGQGAVTANRRLSLGGARPLQLSPQAPQHIETRPTPHQHPQTMGLGTRLHSAPCLLECASGGGRQKIRKQHSDPVVAPSSGLMAVRPLHSSPRLSELMQRSPLPTILGSPSRTIPPFEFPKPPSSPNLVTFLTQQGLVIGSPCSRTAPAEPRDPGQPAPSQVTQPAHCIHRLNDDTKGFGRSQSAGRLSDVLLMAAFGPGGLVGDRGSTENLTSEKAIDITVPPGGGGGLAPGSSSPAQVVFTVGSPPSGSTPPHTSRQRKYSGSFTSLSPAGSYTSRYPQTGTYLDGFEAPSSPRYSFTDPITANMGGPVTFEAPELPEETLMEQEHTDTVQSLRFTLDFARCLMEVAGARGAAAMGELAEMSHPSLLQQQSLVADQISSLSREWSHAEQLVLYLKTAELLSTALHTAMERVKQGKLYPSATVKQLVRRLNELYKSSVASCRSLSTRLERFFSRKHRLMDQITSITAERLLFSHTVQMVQAAALDEMFHQGEASALRYHKALLLMEGLSQLLTEQDDIVSVSKCKECIERRLTALQSGLCV